MKCMKPYSVLSIAVFAVLSGCAITTTVTENAPLAQLEPMEKPGRVEGTRVVQIDKLKGEERHYDILSINDDGTYAGVNQNGCEWVGSGELVAPAVSWGSCGGSGEWSSGEHRNLTKVGELWPLAKGNKVAFTYQQVNSRGEVKPKTKRSCKVNGQVNIDTALGNMDAFKVTCVRRKDTWSKTRVYYFNPDYAYAVKFVESSSGNGIERDVEFLREESI